MARFILLIAAALAASLTCLAPASACSLCGGNPQTAVTLRQAAAQAKLVLYGAMANPRLNPDNIGPPGSGSTDFHVIKALKGGSALGKTTVISVPRYIPVDPKSPPRFILFCDFENNKLDPFRGVPAPSVATFEYVKGLIALDPRNTSQMLLYYFRFLDHADQDVANDAFFEMAKANDEQIGKVARLLSAEKVRRLLLDPKTPADRLSLYAFLLGACGASRDADLLRAMLERPTEKTAKAYDGLLCGYIQLRPHLGWALALAVLGDPRKPFADRFAVLRTLRFYHGWKPDETRKEVFRGLQIMLPQGDIADMAIEDLRRWKIWDLTSAVLEQFGKKSHSAPILRRAIVRYALCCPRAEATQFVASLRKADPDLVADVQESLEFEKAK